MADSYVPLPQSAGYAVVVGLGFVFAFGMMLTTYILRRYNKEVMTAEEFATAGRSVKTGLIAACIVLSWTWSATLNGSTSQVYNNGVCGLIFLCHGCYCSNHFVCMSCHQGKRTCSCCTYIFGNCQR